MTRQTDTQTLIESFCTLADEVQTLIGRKTVLEHKLRFAAEQYQELADKYAPAAPEISETLAKLQLPPDLHQIPIPSSYVPLPRRGSIGCNQHQIALLIRDGRRAAQQLNQTETSGGSSKETSEGTANTSMSTIMEQDFTVEGKKGVLDCPFSKREQQLLRQKQQLERERRASRGAESQNQDDRQHSINGTDGPDPTPHQSNDPICAAMFEDMTSQPAPSSTGAAKCPIRFLDQHSPEEIANYVEKHKNQLPRSHAICLRRYQKSEQQIRKLDAKYGSLVNMISGLGQFHQPMLPTGEDEAGEEPADQEERVAMHTASNERIQKWANAVTASDLEHMSDGHDEKNGENQDASERRNSAGDGHSLRPSNNFGDPTKSAVDGDLDGDNTDAERESRFDRPLKEVRVGESPSRPWGVPIPKLLMPNEDEPPPSPPAAPVRMPSPAASPQQTPAKTPVKKCPFDHTKLAAMKGGSMPFPHGHPGIPHGGASEGDRASVSVPPAADQTERLFTPEKPRQAEAPHPSTFNQMPQPPQMPPMRPMPQMPQMPQMPHMSQDTPMPSSTVPQAPPTFVNLTPQTTAGQANNGTPQMLFTGPVFIGYPIEQAIQFMQHFQGSQGR